MSKSTIRTYLLAYANAYQSASVLMAASELDLFTEIEKRGETTLDRLVNELGLDSKGLDYLLAALLSINLLEKSEGTYRVVPKYAPYLDSRNPDSVIPMLRHQANCARGWSQLAASIKKGVPALDVPGVNSPEIEFQDFILAMNVVAKRLAPEIAHKLSEMGLIRFNKVLDLGGASGTYSFAFLEVNSNTNARAIIFDRPAALEEAKLKAAESPNGARIDLYPGDFYVDPYPQDVDFVWISAIVHQQDDATTETMFRNSFNALRSGGLIAVRDVFINADHVGPKAAAFFGLNMLVRTTNGKVYTIAETIELLTKVGFKNARLAIPAEDMSAVVVAEKQ